VRYFKGMLIMMMRMIVIAMQLSMKSDDHDVTAMMTMMVMIIGDRL